MRRHCPLVEVATASFLRRCRPMVTLTLVLYLKGKKLHESKRECGLRAVFSTSHPMTLSPTGNLLTSGLTPSIMGRRRSIRETMEEMETGELQLPSRKTSLHFAATSTGYSAMRAVGRKGSADDESDLKKPHYAGMRIDLLAGKLATCRSCRWTLGKLMGWGE